MACSSASRTRACRNRYPASSGSTTSAPRAVSEVSVGPSSGTPATASSSSVVNVVPEERDPLERPLDGERQRGVDRRRLPALGGAAHLQHGERQAGADVADPLERRLVQRRGTAARASRWWRPWSSGRTRAPADAAGHQAAQRPRASRRRCRGGAPAGGAPAPHRAAGQVVQQPQRPLVRLVDVVHTSSSAVTRRPPAAAALRPPGTAAGGRSRRPRRRPGPTGPAPPRRGRCRPARPGGRGAGGRGHPGPPAPARTATAPRRRRPYRARSAIRAARPGRWPSPGLRTCPPRVGPSRSACFPSLVGPVQAGADLVAGLAAADQPRAGLGGPGDGRPPTAPSSTALRSSCASALGRCPAPGEGPGPGARAASARPVVAPVDMAGAIARWACSSAASSSRTASHRPVSRSRSRCSAAGLARLQVHGS